MENRKSVDVLFLDISKALGSSCIFVGEVEIGGHLRCIKA